MNRSNPSAAESASQVSAALVPRAADVAADIYRLIVQEIQPLRGDKRMQALLEASVAENVSTMLHILQHGIDLENVRAPAAAEEYARRLAQHGAPVAALLRAYRIGSARFEEWCLQELGRPKQAPHDVGAGDRRHRTRDAVAPFAKPPAIHLARGGQVVWIFLLVREDRRVHVAHTRIHKRARSLLTF